MRKLLFIALSCAPVLAQADNGTGAIGTALNGICSAASDPLAARRIGAGQRLEELPGQGRASTRSQQQDKIVSEDLGEGWSVFLSADLG